MTKELRVLYIIAFTALGALLATVHPPVQHWPDLETRIEMGE